MLQPRALTIYSPRMLQVGVAKVEITTYEPRLGMMGWGMLHNFVESVATPLHARAFVLRDGDRRLAMVVCELAFISLALKEAVCDKLRREHADLGLDETSVMMMATHTHSGPGGFTHYPFYNVTISGFSAHVLEHLAGGVVRAIVDAAGRGQAARVTWREGEVPADGEIAFNRAIEAYNQNPDVEPVTEEERTKALDLTMRMLSFETEDGRPLASINWFAVHCTSVHSDNTAIHFDNKGYAAQLTEEDMAARGHDGYIAAFAQAAPGDVTPNFKYYPEKPWMRGKFLDDDESARFNGRGQADCALSMLERDGTPMPARIGAAHSFADMSAVDVAPEFVGGREGLRTAPAEIGMAMFFGTEEGPGLPRPLVFLQKWISGARNIGGLRGAKHRREYAQWQAEKVPWIESGVRRLLGMRRLAALPLPWRRHRALRVIREMARAGDDPKPWTPNVLPAQVFVIGTAAISAVPHEFTTVSGRRLRATVQGRLEGLGVEHSVLAGYANAYAGYVVTPEEYSVQDYEGASTHFGKWTLPAYQTLFAGLAESLADADATITVDLSRAKPPRFTEQELAAQAFPA